MCIKVKLDSDSGHAPTAKARWAGMSWKMCGSLAALAAHVKPVSTGTGRAKARSCCLVLRPSSLVAWLAKSRSSNNNNQPEHHAF